MKSLTGRAAGRPAVSYSAIYSYRSPKVSIVDNLLVDCLGSRQALPISHLPPSSTSPVPSSRYEAPGRRFVCTSCRNRSIIGLDAVEMFDHRRVAPCHRLGARPRPSSMQAVIIPARRVMFPILLGQLLVLDFRKLTSNNG